MIQHEITINTGQDYHYLKTFNRDLEYHREGGLPAWRMWCENGTLKSEFYCLNGDKHREGGLPAKRNWHENGNLWYEIYYLHGELHRDGNLPAERG